MIKEVFKTILAGIFVGTALFLMPFFLVKVLVIFMLIKMAFSLMGHGCCRGHFSHRYHNMTEEQKEAFRKKFGGRECCSSEKTSAASQE